MNKAKNYRFTSLLWYVPTAKWFPTFFLLFFVNFFNLLEAKNLKRQEKVLKLKDFQIQVCQKTQILQKQKIGKFTKSSKPKNALKTLLAFACPVVDILSV